MNAKRVPSGDHASEVSPASVVTSGSSAEPSRLIEKASFVPPPRPGGRRKEIRGSAPAATVNVTGADVAALPAASDCDAVAVYWPSASSADARLKAPPVPIAASNVCSGEPVADAPEYTRSVT